MPELRLTMHRGPQHWTVQSLQRSALFGYSLASGADVNGDGYPDLLVGAPRHKADTRHEGLTFLFQGRMNGMQDVPLWIVKGTIRNANQGGVVALCDVNGDQFADIFVGVPRSLDTNGPVSRVVVHYGTGGELSTTPQAFFPRLDEFPYVASDLVAAGDVNGDGYQDMLATERSYTRDHKAEGAALLYLGSKTGIVTRAAWSVLGQQRNANLGLGCAGVGDVNGDGYDDVVIGMPGFTREGRKLGKACLYLGSAAGLAREPAWTMEGLEPEGSFGRTVGTAGDLNRDGLGDFLISAPGGGASTNLPGTVFLFLGSRTNISFQPTWQVSGEIPGGAFGHSARSGADIDGDGLNDLLVGAPQVLGKKRQKEGRVYLFCGQGMFFARQPEWILMGGMEDARLGRVLSPMTDLNKDGFADFAIGLPFYSPDRAAENHLGQAGRVDVFFGGTNGYRAGQVFPTDGTNSTNVGGPSEAEDLSLVAATAVVPSTSRGLIYIIPVTGAFVFGVGAFLLRRNRENVARAERARIARDLHDDLGAQLSILQRETAGANPAASREAMLALDRAVWTANPENDTLENLVSFIGQYGGEFFAESGIRFRFEAPIDVPEEQLSPERRKNVFLAVKEALHNVLKHSGASEVLVNVHLEIGLLKIVVEDNGKGILPDNRGGGNGLQNMSERMKAVRGQVEFGRGKSGGARITFTVSRED